MSKLINRLFSRASGDIYQQGGNATHRMAYNMQNTGTKAGGKSVSGKKAGGGGGGKKKAPAVEVQGPLLGDRYAGGYDAFIKGQQSEIKKLYGSIQREPTGKSFFDEGISQRNANIDAANLFRKQGMKYRDFVDKGYGDYASRQEIYSKDIGRQAEIKDVIAKRKAFEEEEYSAFFGEAAQREARLEAAIPARDDAFASIMNRRKAETAAFEKESARREAAIARHRTPTLEEHRTRLNAEYDALAVGRTPQEISDIMYGDMIRRQEADAFINSLHSPAIKPLEGGSSIRMGVDAIKASTDVDPSKIAAGMGDINVSPMEVLREIPGAIGEAIGRSKALDGLGYYSGSAAIGIGAMSMAEGEMSMGTVVGGAMAGVGGGVVGRLAAGSLKGGFLNQSIGGLGRSLGGAGDDAYFAGARNAAGSSMTNAANALSGMSDATMTRTMRGMTFAGAGLTGYSMGRDRDHSRGFNSGRGNRF